MSCGNLTGSDLTVRRLTANGINNLSSGLFSVVVGSTTAVIPIPGLTTGGVVNLTYLHPEAGGAGQYFRTYTPSANQLTLGLATVGSVGDSIIWSVAQF